MKKNRGFVLVVVLVLLNVVGLISIHLLNFAWLQSKKTIAMREDLKINELAESALQMAEFRVNSSSAYFCEISEMTSTELLKKPLEWWSFYACHGNISLFQYYFVVESLGEDSCALMEIDAHLLKVHYYRITLLGKLGNKQVLVESVFIKPVSRKSEQCNKESHVVTTGRQTWRDLTHI